jgi:hypothetical protein
MRVGDQYAFVRFEFKEKVADNLPGAGDVGCSVEVSCDGFQGTVPSVWFSRAEIEDFLSQLKQLQEWQQRSVNLSNMSSQSDYNPFRFEILCIDESGHLVVNAELIKVSYRSEGLTPLKVSVGFPFDREQLSLTVTEFRKLLT